MNKKNSLKTILPTIPEPTQSSFRYAELLLRTIDDKPVTNVALMGGNCTGKSSAIEAFKNMVEKDHVKTISFLTFSTNKEKTGGDNDRMSDKGDRKSDRPIIQVLQSEIVRQLLYSESPFRLRFSRYGRLNSRLYFLISALLSILLSLGLYPSFYRFFHSILQNSFLFNWKVGLFPFATSLTGFISISFSIIFSFVTFMAISTILPKIHISRFSFGELSAALNDAEPDFNQLTDEIINLFKYTAYKYVIFEDIDRFNRIEIFEALRQLNLQLNESKEINRRIVFIYAIRDSLIPDSNDRAKLFDAIIPVVPFLSPFSIKTALEHTGTKVGLDIDNNDLKNLIASELRDEREIKVFTCLAQSHIEHFSNIPWADNNKIIAMALLRYKFPTIYENAQSSFGTLNIMFKECFEAQQSRLAKLTDDIEFYKNIPNFISSIRASYIMSTLNAKLPRANYGDVRLYADGKTLIPNPNFNSKEFWEKVLAGNIFWNRASDYNHKTEQLDRCTFAECFDEKNALVKMLDFMQNNSEYYENNYDAEKRKSPWSYLGDSDDGLADFLKKLCDCGVLDSDYALYIAPPLDNYPTDALEVEKFRMINIPLGLIDFDFKLSPKQVLKIDSSLNKYDYRNKALLNKSFFFQILFEKITRLTKEEFVDFQTNNLDLFLRFVRSFILDRDINLKVNKTSSNILDNFLTVSAYFAHNFLDELYQKLFCELLVFAENNRYPLCHILLYSLLFEMSQKGMQIELEDKIFFERHLKTLLNFPNIYKPEILIKIMKNNNILLADLSGVAKKEPREAILSSGLCRLNRKNIMTIDVGSILPMLETNPFSEPSLIDILQDGRISKDKVDVIVSWILAEHKNDLGQDLAIVISDCISKKKLKLSYDKLSILNGKIPIKNYLKLIYEMNFSDEDFVHALIESKDTNFAKLEKCETGERLFIAEDKIYPYTKIFDRLETLGKVKITSLGKKIRATIL